MADVTAERLREKAIYLPETGKFFTNNHLRKPMGCTRHDGYVVIRVDYKLYLAHRLAWLYVHGDWPMGILDHIDKNPRNNRIDNLRIVTHRQNHVNMHPPINNTSGFVGVSWHKEARKWCASCGRKHLGLFTSKEEAAAAVAAERERILSTNLIDLKTPGAIETGVQYPLETGLATIFGARK